MVALPAGVLADAIAPDLRPRPASTGELLEILGSIISGQPGSTRYIWLRREVLLEVVGWKRTSLLVVRLPRQHAAVGYRYMNPKPPKFCCTILQFSVSLKFYRKNVGPVDNWCCICVVEFGWVWAYKDNSVFCWMFLVFVGQEILIQRSWKRRKLMCRLAAEVASGD